MKFHKISIKAQKRLGTYLVTNHEGHTFQVSTKADANDIARASRDVVATLKKYYKNKKK
jgi:hypothetical protein